MHSYSNEYYNELRVNLVFFFFFVSTFVKWRVVFDLAMKNFAACVAGVIRIMFSIMMVKGRN